jgi:uncharacterized membrane protein YhiD involved in acid resistance
MNEINLLQTAGMVHIYDSATVLTNIVLSILLGMFISYVYKATHRGMSYSQSFMLTIVFVTIIVSLVMMIIGNNIARAFALVGALSIIRFRTVVKDTKDTAYIFLALASGMAAGTGSYFIAISGSLIFSMVSFTLHYFNYGAYYKSEFILKFRAPISEEDSKYIDVINKFTKRSDILHIEPFGDRETVKLTYDLLLKKDTEANKLTYELDRLNNVSEILLIASKHDVDY